MPAYAVVLKVPVCIKLNCGRLATHSVHSHNGDLIANFCLEHSQVAVRKLNTMPRFTEEPLDATQFDHPDQRDGSPGP